MNKPVSFGVVCAALLALPQAGRANLLYFAQPFNYNGTETDTVFVYGAAGTTGTVSSPNGFASAFTVGSGNVASVNVPNAYDLGNSGVVTNNGFVVSTTSASASVGATYLSRQLYTTDATYLFDSTALGTSYYAVGTATTGGYPSQLTIVGTQAGTTVTVTPSTNLAGYRNAGKPFTETLGAGQAVLYTDTTYVGQDITGTRITSTAPIAVFGGNQCANIPANSGYCDHTLTALPSTDKYTTHAVIPTTTGTEGVSSNILRILAATDGTVVSFNGQVVATLEAGQFADIRTGAGGELTANNPVLLNEYLTGQTEHQGVPGDPAKSYVPGVDQWLSSYVFSTPVGSQGYQANFLDLSILAGDVASLVLNGAAVPAADCAPLSGSNYDTCDIPVAAGAGAISAASPFLLLIDGGTLYDSYFTFGGTTFSPGASPTAQQAVPEPASLSLLALGLGGLLAGGARRRRA